MILIVIPAKAGIHSFQMFTNALICFFQGDGGFLQRCLFSEKNSDRASAHDCAACIF
jgi:hypothetical protein